MLWKPISELTVAAQCPRQRNKYLLQPRLCFVRTYRNYLFSVKEHVDRASDGALWPSTLSYCKAEAESLTHSTDSEHI